MLCVSRVPLVSLVDTSVEAPGLCVCPLCYPPMLTSQSCRTEVANIS